MDGCIEVKFHKDKKIVLTTRDKSNVLHDIIDIPNEQAITLAKAILIKLEPSALK